MTIQTRKQLQKIKAGFVAMVLCMSMFSTFAYAAEETPLVITSGLELHQEMKRVGMETDDMEVIVAEVVDEAELDKGIRPQVTFEKNRMIYGEALPGTTVVLGVEQLDENDEWVLCTEEEQVANSLGMFAFVMPLELGRNQITLFAEADGHETVCYQLQMERISEEVKEQLKSLVALPTTIQSNKG